MSHTLSAPPVASGGRSRKEQRWGNFSRAGQPGGFYRGSDPLPKLKSGAKIGAKIKEHEWDTIPFEEGRPDRYWRLGARSPSPYDRASGSPPPLSCICTWVVKKERRGIKNGPSDASR